MIPEKRCITQWDEAERPREKMLSLGAGALTNAELLGILIGSGNAEETAVDLMRRILNDNGDSLKALGRMSADDFCLYNGIGPAKAVTLIAACELGRRRAAEKDDGRIRVTSSHEIFNYFYPKMEACETEECHVLMLNNRLAIVGERLVSRGGLTATTVDIRMVMRSVLLAKATSFALIHNHPSGSNRPSREDDHLTRSVKTAAEALQLNFIDHVIFAGDTYYSYADEGKL